MSVKPTTSKTAEALDLAPLASQLPSVIVKGLREVTELMYMHLAETQQAKTRIQLDKCAELAIGLALKLRAMYGGGSLYIPMGFRNIAERNEEIKAEFNGRNLHILAQKHGLSTMSIRNIANNGTNKQNYKSRKRPLAELVSQSSARSPADATKRSTSTPTESHPWKNTPFDLRKPSPF